MATIRNTNEKYGDAIAFSGHDLDEAVSRMQQAIRECGLENVVVSSDDYDILDESEMLFNFKDNGDVFTMINGVEGEYVGRVDSDGDWRPSDDCQYSESEIRDDLSAQVEFFNDWVWPVEFLIFLK